MAPSDSPNAALPRTPRGRVGQPITGNRELDGARRYAGPALWPQLDSADTARLIANLRGTGCPEQTIREIILLRLARKYRQRLLEADAEAARSWNCARGLPRAHFSKRQKLRTQLLNELSAGLESLLGVDLDSLRQSVFLFPPCGAGRLDFLPGAKRRKVRDIEARYQELKQDLNMSGMMGLFDAEDRAALRRLETEKKAELAGILSAVELEEYLYRSSAAADYVRNNLPAAKSEQEFRQMVQVALEMDMIDEPVSFQHRYGLPGPDDPGAKEVEARKAAFEERLKQVLGEQRVAEQKAAEQKRLAEEKRRRDQESQEQERARIIGIAAPLGISAEETGRFLDRLDELKSALQAKFDELQNTLTGAEEEKRERMQAAITVELEKVACATIGEKGRQLVEKIQSLNP